MLQNSKYCTGNMNTIAGEGKFRRGKGDTKLSFFTDPVIEYNKCGLSYSFFLFVSVKLDCFVFEHY